MQSPELFSSQPAASLIIESPQTSLEAQLASLHLQSAQAIAAMKVELASAQAKILQLTRANTSLSTIISSSHPSSIHTLPTQVISSSSKQQGNTTRGHKRLRQSTLFGSSPRTFSAENTATKAPAGFTEYNTFYKWFRNIFFAIQDGPFKAGAAWKVYKQRGKHLPSAPATIPLLPPHLCPVAAAAKAPSGMPTYNEFYGWFRSHYPKHNSDPAKAGEAWSLYKGRSSMEAGARIKKACRDKAGHIEVLKEIKARGEFALQYGLPPWNTTHSQKATKQRKWRAVDKLLVALLPTLYELSSNNRARGVALLHELLSHKTMRAFQSPSSMDGSTAAAVNIAMAIATGLRQLTPAQRGTNQGRLVLTLVEEFMVTSSASSSDLRSLAAIILSFGAEVAMAESVTAGTFESKLKHVAKRLLKAQHRRCQKRDWPMTAGTKARKRRSDRLMHETLALVRGTIDTNTQVSPAKKDIIWVVDECSGCRYQHPKHYQHVTDPALLQLVNDAIQPYEIGIDKLRKIKRKMKYVKRVGFRSCLCVVCLIIKLLLAAAHKKKNRDNIIKNIHCRTAHSNCQCKYPAVRAPTCAISIMGGGENYPPPASAMSSSSPSVTSSSPPSAISSSSPSIAFPSPPSAASSMPPSAASSLTPSAESSLPPSAASLLPRSAVSSLHQSAASSLPPPSTGVAYTTTNIGTTTSSSSDSDYEPDSDCNSEYDSTYDSDWEARLEGEASDAGTAPAAAQGCIQAMLATRSVTDCLKHIMCPMEQVPGFTSKTFKKACMLGECPHCGWEKKLDYAMESDFPHHLARL
jgi:hypothetical protein